MNLVYQTIWQDDQSSNENRRKDVIPPNWGENTHTVNKTRQVAIPSQRSIRPLASFALLSLVVVG